MTGKLLRDLKLTGLTDPDWVPPQLRPFAVEHYYPTYADYLAAVIRARMRGSVYSPHPSGLTVGTLPRSFRISLWNRRAPDELLLPSPGEGGELLVSVASSFQSASSIETS